MGSEIFLIVLRKETPPEASARTLSVMKRLGVKIELVTDRGRAMIATLDHALADTLRNLPYVELVGGVRIRKRTLVRRRDV